MVKVAWLCEYTNKTTEQYTFKRVNFRIYELYLNFSKKYLLEDNKISKDCLSEGETCQQQKLRKGEETKLPCPEKKLHLQRDQELGLFPLKRLLFIFFFLPLVACGILIP